MSAHRSCQAARPQISPVSGMPDRARTSSLLTESRVEAERKPRSAVRSQKGQWAMKRMRVGAAAARPFRQPPPNPQQRTLPDARRATHHQHPAIPGESARNCRLDRRDLSLAIEQAMQNPDLDHHAPALRPMSGAMSGSTPIETTSAREDDYERDTTSIRFFPATS